MVTTFDETERRRLGGDQLRFASRWWAGESEVARTFFSQPHSKQEHLRWLRHQAYKELQPRSDGLILRLVEKLGAEYPALEHGVDRSSYLRTMQFLLEEFRHYVLFADVIDAITGEKLTTEELVAYELPEERKLREIRESSFVRWGDLARSASSFCEGGGASIFYEGMQATGDPLSKMISAACESVYRDEMDHAHHGVEDLVRVAQTESDWEAARSLIEQISRQRLRMRNEQFGFPVTEERVEEIGRGEIELPERFQALLA